MGRDVWVKPFPFSSCRGICWLRWKTVLINSDPTQSAKSGDVRIILRPQKSEVKNPTLTKTSGPKKNLTFDLVGIKSNIFDRL